MNRSTVAPLAMPGRCCWPASTKCSRSAAPNAGARCGSSPASPRRRRCATSSSPRPTDGATHHRPGPRPAAVGGAGRCRQRRTPRGHSRPTRSGLRLRSAPRLVVRHPRAPPWRGVGGGLRRLPPTDLKSARQHRIAARSIRESASPPRGRRIVSACSPLDQHHPIRNTRVRAVEFPILTTWSRSPDVLATRTVYLCSHWQTQRRRITADDSSASQQSAAGCNQSPAARLNHQHR